jgi:hypothetical protein
VCGEPVRVNEAVYARDGAIFCRECAAKYGAVCFHCREFYYFDSKYNEDEVEIRRCRVNLGHSVYRLYFCDRCAEEYLWSYECGVCGERVRVYYGYYVGSALMRALVSAGKCCKCYVEGLFEDYKDSRQLKLFDDVIERLKEFVRSLK